MTLANEQSVPLLEEEKPNLMKMETVRNLPLRNFLWATLDFLRPEILQRRKVASSPRAGKTAWLDGLRGAAALCVCITHLTSYTHTGMEMCYGAKLGDDEWNYGLTSLPIIRIPFTGGHFSVTLFFVISGYVVPRRMISLLHQGRKDEFVEAVNSAMFRRPLRLFLPVIWSTLFLWLLWHIFNIETPFPDHQPTFLLEGLHWIKDQLKFLYFFRIGVLFSWYNFHTWTIPVEMRGSMFLFTWLFTLHQLATRPRVLATLGMVLYLAIGAPGGWYACFFAGMLTGELDMLAQESAQVKLPWDGIAKWFQAKKGFRLLTYHFLLFGGLYLASQPSSDSHARADVLGDCAVWKYLDYLIPPAYVDDTNSTWRWFFLFWASWMTLVSIKEIPWARWIFESSPSQYLGRHSFALYLVHGPLIGILSERLFFLTGVKKPTDLPSFTRYGHLHNKWHDASWWPFSDAGPKGLEPSFLVCVFISIPVFLYFAELGTKAFDLPSVRVSNWLYGRMKGVR